MGVLCKCHIADLMKKAEFEGTNVFFIGLAIAICVGPFLEMLWLGVRVTPAIIANPGYWGSVLMFHRFQRPCCGHAQFRKISLKCTVFRLFDWLSWYSRLCLAAKPSDKSLCRLSSTSWVSDVLARAGGDGNSNCNLSSSLYALQCMKKNVGHGSGLVSGLSCNVQLQFELQTF